MTRTNAIVRSTFLVLVCSVLNTKPTLAQFGPYNNCDEFYTYVENHCYNVCSMGCGWYGTPANLHWWAQGCYGGQMTCT